MAAPHFEDEGRYSESCRRASWVVLTRPWNLLLLVLVCALVLWSA